MIINKYDMKVGTVILAADDTYEDVGEPVPKDNTRFVCYVKAAIRVIGEKIIIAESTNAVGGTPAPVYTIKDAPRLLVPGVIEYPDKIDVVNPLFSIEEEQYMSVKGDSSGDVITIKYYDINWRSV